MYTEQLSQYLTLVDVLNYQTVTNASVNSTVGVDMQKFRRVIFWINVPSTGAAGTLDGRLQSAALSNFATPHNITGTNLTQITQASTPGNNGWSSIEVRADQVVAQNPADRYVRANLTGGGNAITVLMLAFGAEAEQSPGNQYALSNSYLSQNVVCNT